jgi:hypothetical protein
MSIASMRKLRAAITRDELKQFLYVLRSDMARILRQLEDIDRKLEGARQRPIGGQNRGRDDNP